MFFSTGDLLAQRAWQLLFLEFYRGSARLIAQHFINREQKKKTGRCVCGGGSHSHSSLLHSTTRLIIFHNPSAIPVPELWLHGVALLVLSCRRVCLTASFACACRRFVTRKSCTVSRLPLRVCGRPRSVSVPHGAQAPGVSQRNSIISFSRDRLLSIYLSLVGAAEA